MSRAARAAAVLVLAATSTVPLVSANAGAAPNERSSPAQELAAYWTAERRAAAQPRDLVIDERGLGYLRRADGSLQPHGHSRPAALVAVTDGQPVPRAKPGGGGGGGGDTTPPSVSNMKPADETIGSAFTFTATVTDVGSGVKSVSFVLTSPGGGSQSYAAGSSDGTNWSISFSGFTDGDDWSWSVVAKDNAPRGGNTTTEGPVNFTVSTGGGGGGGGGDGTVVTNSPWDKPTATVQNAAGRIYFEMPTNSRLTRWAGYVCSGTVATDAATDRSVIITAAHCVYDDAYKSFARNVMFIPNQDATTGAGTDLDCSNDPLGCWAPTFGVVDNDWASRTFPDNIPWDYGYYVVPTSGAHTAGSSNTTNENLESAAGKLAIQFADPTTGTYTYALGYSYSDDPNFMYCAEGLGTESAYGDWWLASCELSGGSSGGPWMQSAGEGPIISVNSWGYSNSPGMAGPKLAVTAECLFGVAQTGGTPSTTTRGIVSTCP
jgi:hypothetical protein